jgi:tetratricopeptide (TPR) repeat protein
VRYIAKRFPDDPSLALTRALLLEAKGKKEIAEVFLTKALEGQDKRMGIATAVGDVRLRQGLPLEALRLAKRDLAKNPNYFRANVVAGEACTKLKRYKEGATYLRKAYELNPLDERFVNNYATDLYRSGQYVEALEPSLIFLATATKPDLLHKAKYQLQLLMKRTTEAQLITAVRSADKKLDHTLYQGRLHLALGDVFDKQGKRKLAEECYARGIELLPDIGRAYYRLARDFEKDKNYRQAYQLYQKAYSLEPKDNQVAAGYFRFGERYSNRDNDLAWKLKDMIRKQ